MSAALQIHRIACPANPEVRERLHTHLWKQFPMDAFRFLESAGTTDPSYEGTRLGPLVDEEDDRSKRSEVFLDNVQEAVSAFISESAAVAA